MYSSSSLFLYSSPRFLAQLSLSLGESLVSRVWESRVLSFKTWAIESHVAVLVVNQRIKKANNSYQHFRVEHGENSRRCLNKACIIKC